MQTNTATLSLKEKVGYAVGDTASNIFFQTIMLFMTYFYTDVFGLPTAAIATLIPGYSNLGCR